GLMTDLNALVPAGSGWVLHEARAINDARQIAAVGAIGGGGDHALLLVAGCCETVTPGDTASTEPICDDGNPCTLDQCAADHTCMHRIVDACCLADGDCDDGSFCTADACDRSTT